MGYSEIVIYTYDWPIIWVQNFEAQYVFGFLEKMYIFGVKIGDITKLGYFWVVGVGGGDGDRCGGWGRASGIVIPMHLRVFS